MTQTDIDQALEVLRSNEDILAVSELEASDRHVRRVALMKTLTASGVTQQKLTNVINDVRLTHGAKPLTVHAVQKALVRVRD